ncbi:hypothetical protein GCM10025867_43180 [Frondihabitans sucicola]|uniref:Uncharacterized protein n=1 Tax=Frondihabitans sucicola TaxID=1268041 RepID=A0ABN6Y404_9MICO|nr:hypothetical protein GCM10025867_43180 [Frondihabitans sucicola]
MVAGDVDEDVDVVVADAGTRLLIGRIGEVPLAGAGVRSDQQHVHLADALALRRGGDRCRRVPGQLGDVHEGLRGGHDVVRRVGDDRQRRYDRDSHDDPDQTERVREGLGGREPPVFHLRRRRDDVGGLVVCHVAPSFRGALGFRAPRLRVSDR